MSVVVSFSPFPLTFSISLFVSRFPFISTLSPYSPFVRVMLAPTYSELAVVQTDAGNLSVTTVVDWLLLIQAIAINTFSYLLSNCIQIYSDIFRLHWRYDMYYKFSMQNVSLELQSIDCNFVKYIFHYVIQNEYLVAAIAYWKQNKDKEISLCSLAIRQKCCKSIWSIPALILGY